MLIGKFQNHRPTGSGEEDFERFLLFIVMVAILVMTWTIYINFCSPSLRMLHMKFGFDGYTISSPVSLQLR